MSNKFSFFYIGNREQTISELKKYTNGELHIISDIKNIGKEIEEIEKEDIIYWHLLFVEKELIKNNEKNLSEILKNNRNIYALAITGEISREERLEYLRTGIRNSFPPSLSEEKFREILGVIEKEFLFLEKSKKIERKETVRFKLPLWKRLFDIIFSSFAILILSPLFIIIAIAIKIESKGPIVYKAKRVGSNYNIFDFLKFRSMYVGADAKIKELAALNQYQLNDKEIVTEGKSITFGDDMDISDDLTPEDIENMLIADDEIIEEKDYLYKKNYEQENAFVKLQNDPRITKVGRFIRKYSIDELPQLFNILKGDMSVVGNRPLPIYEAELLTSDEYIDRFMAPAGLTGLWQVEKRGDSGKMSAEERKMLDIKYAKTFNLWLDIKIIFKTLTAFIQKEDV